MARHFVESTRPPDRPPRPDPARGRRARLAWGTHWFLRYVLAVILAIYGWFKIWMIQMGHVDVGEALIRFGEMSPQGLLWKMVAYSPAFQILAGVEELTAALLLVQRRTAWLGAALAAAGMGFVVLLNLGYDVPVKIPAIVYLLMALLVLLPYRRHLVRIVRGRGVPPMPVPAVFPGAARLAHVGPALAVLSLLAIGAGSRALGLLDDAAASPITGVYRVLEDVNPPARQLSTDARWQEIAFGDRKRAGVTLVTVRRADGRLLYGDYRILSEGVAEVTMSDELRGARTPWPTKEHPQTLTYERLPDGGLHLRTADQDLTVVPDQEGTFLFERGFRWAPESVIR